MLVGAMVCGSDVELGCIWLCCVTGLGVRETLGDLVYGDVGMLAIRESLVSRCRLVERL
jgi:hypothetical protein